MVDQPSDPTWGVPPPPPPPPIPPPGVWLGVIPQPFRSLRGLAVAMTVLLAIAGVIAVILVPVALHERQVVHDGTTAGSVFVGPEVRDAVDAVNGVAGLYFAIFISIAVLWMIWMWRAATNTALLRRYKPRFASGFAIGGWFIPIAFWIIPGMHMYDIDKGSGPPARPGERPQGSGLLVWWWVLFVIGWIGSSFGQVTLKRARRYDTSAFDVRNTVFVVGMCAVVLAAVLAIMVVRSITRTQHDAWDAVAGGAGSGPFAPAPAPWAPDASAPYSSVVPPPVAAPPPAHSPVPEPPPTWPGAPPSDP